MRIARDKAKLFFLTVSLLAFLFGFVNGFLLSPRPGKVMVSMTQHGWVGTPFVLEVSPMGYPTIGESWSIFVYEGEISSGVLNLQPSSNSTVMVTLKQNDYKRVYYLPVDENGQVSFEYLSDYRDIAFQAFCGELSSRKIIMSEHYVSANVLNSLSAFSIFISIISAITGGLGFRHTKPGKLMKVALLLVFSLFAFVMFSSLYAKYFLETAWGYPENIVNGIVTLTLLKYTSYVSVVLLAVIWVIFWMLVWRSPKKGVSSLFEEPHRPALRARVCIEDILLTVSIFK